MWWFLILLGLTVWFFGPVGVLVVIAVLMFLLLVLVAADVACGDD